MPSGPLSELIIHLLYIIILCQFIACTLCSSVTQGGNLWEDQTKAEVHVLLSESSQSWQVLDWISVNSSVLQLLPVIG